MMNMQVFNRRSEKILKSCIFIGLSILFIRLASFHLRVITYHFPLTAAESQPLLNTYLILTGINPYDLVNQPESTNVYGILYPFIVSPIAKLFGINLIVHRGVSSFFIIAACGIVFLVTRWIKISLLLSFIATLIFYWHLILAYSFIAKSDSLGLFLFLCSIVIPWRYNYSSLSLIISIVLGILAFMAKPYFALSIFYLAIYVFVFKSKKKGIEYGFLAGFLFLITLFLLNHFFECYFNNTFFIHINILEFTESGFYYVFEQFFTYSQNNFGIIILFFTLILLFIKKIWKEVSRISLVEFKEKIITFKENIYDLDKPLSKIDLDLFTFCLMLSLIIFYFKMGKHAGNWLVYLYHLISPFLIIVVFKFASKLTEKALILILLIIIINLFFTYPTEKISNTRMETYKQWENISNLVSQHQNILNSPIIAPLLIRQGKKVYDSGESEYFILGAGRKKNISLMRTAHKIEKRNQDFLQEIRKSIKKNKYDLIVLTKDHLPVGYNRFIYKYVNLINKCYEYQGTLPATMLTQTIELNIWKPKQISCDSISN